MTRHDGSEDRRRYALCGLSNRGLSLFVRPLTGAVDDSGDPGADFSSYGQLVAVVDTDAERVAAFNRRLSRPIPYFRPADFDRMVAETGPDVVLVAAPDYTHERYTVAALRHDIDVITEKPMAASCEQVRSMLAAERASKASIRVTHNVRYSPRSRLLKQLVSDGRLGRITNVEMVWNVDTRHGSSYFSRWNRQRAYSGGLSIHKGCHHFDLVNWLIDDVPTQVFASGALNYYGSNSPHNPANRDGVAYSVGEQQARCPYFDRWSANDDDPPDQNAVRTSALGLPYTTQYPPDAPIYIYDSEIDIEDTYSAVVRFRGGPSMAYSIIFSAPWEGYRLAINGTHGRIETSTATFPDGDEPHPDGQAITFYPMFGKPEVHEVPAGVGGHGGADPLLQRDLFIGSAPESVGLGLPADSRQGAMAVAIGEAVWRSARDHRAYDIAELLGEFA